MAPVTTVKPTVVAKPMAPVAEPKVITVPPAAVAKPVVVPTPSIDLADIQAELSSEVADLGEGLVDSVKTANANRQLKVALGSGWDSLSGAEQQEVAQKLWGRSQKLDFKKIELFNGNNTLVARSPVVGTKVIMLQKSTLDSST
jgi:hypothetical protein